MTNFQLVDKLRPRIPHIDTGKKTTDIVHEYTFLGTRVSSTGNFNVSLEHLKEKTLFALFGSRKNTGISGLKPFLVLKYSTR